MMGTFTTGDNLSLYYEDDGTGLPVVCLPGLTRNARDFDFLAPALAGKRMIRLDSRGRGQSAFDPMYANYNVMREAQDVLELLDYLALEKAALIGTSRGGLLAMMLAAIAPGRLSAVVLNDVGPELDPNGIERILDYVGRKPAFTSYEQAALALHTAMKADFPDVPLSVWRQMVEGQYDAREDHLALRYDPALRSALSEQAEAGPPPDLWPLFDALAQMPAGVVRGVNSDVLMASTYAEMQRRNPDLIAVEVPNRGHAPFLNEPEAVRLIEQVLEQIA